MADAVNVQLTLDELVALDRVVGSIPESVASRALISSTELAAFKRAQLKLDDAALLELGIAAQLASRRST